MSDNGTKTSRHGGGSITIGLLRLTDAAPVIVAAENGHFARHGLDVRLSVEPSWANIADKLTYGRLNAAVMLPPLAFAVSLGLRGIGTPLVVPMSLSLNGNSVTFSNTLADAVGQGVREGDAMEVGARLRDVIMRQDRRLRFSVVHVYSTHSLLLRYWLAASGINPDRDVALSVVSPAETVAALRDGHIDGFCAGAPWGSVAAASGVGRTVITSSQIWRDHPEKCIAVPRSWALVNPGRLDALIDALIEAARFCDDPANADTVAHMLADRRYLALDPAAIRESLPAVEPTVLGNVDRSIFFSHAANFPRSSHADWFLGQMARWGHLPPEIDRGRAAAIYRPDLFQAAALRAGIPVPAGDAKPEAADAFCDGPA